MSDEDTPRKVAIACQGGGSHAAFAAGVLCELFKPEYVGRFDLLALSGTSGGAMCAATAWSALVRKPGDWAHARDAARAFWEDVMIGPDNLWDAAADLLAVWYARQPFAVEVPLYGRGVCEPALRDLVRKHVFDGLPKADRSPPELFVGATDVLSGNGVVVCGQQLTENALIASAAVPPLFSAVTVKHLSEGKPHDHHCWDGLFFHNPPIRQFLDLPTKPDEIWVIQIDPQCCRRVPARMSQIIDRRNELSGNLSLNQELYFVRKMNVLARAFPVLASRYQRIRLRRVQLDMNLDYPSKLDRRPSLIRSLMAHGAEQAHRFLTPDSLWRPPRGDECLRLQQPRRAPARGQRRLRALQPAEETAS